MYSYNYPRPALTVDAVLFQYLRGSLYLLLIKRGNEPFRGSWALPGGFVNENETAEQAVERELMEETGIVPKNLKQFYTATTPGRDPRGWTVSVVFIAMLPPVEFAVRAGDDACQADWHSVNSLPVLAFDHGDIIQRAVSYLTSCIARGECITELLSENFSERALTELLETLWKEEPDIKKLLSQFRQSGLIR